MQPGAKLIGATFGPVDPRHEVGFAQRRRQEVIAAGLPGRRVVGVGVEEKVGVLDDGVDDVATSQGLGGIEAQANAESGVVVGSGADGEGHRRQPCQQVVEDLASEDPSRGRPLRRIARHGGQR